MSVPFQPFVPTFYPNSEKKTLFLHMYDVGGEHTNVCLYAQDMFVCGHFYAWSIMEVFILLHYHMYI